MKWRCVACDHVWDSPPDDHCPNCGGNELINAADTRGGKRLRGTPTPTPIPTPFVPMHAGSFAFGMPTLLSTTPYGGALGSSTASFGAMGCSGMPPSFVLPPVVKTATPTLVLAHAVILVDHAERRTFADAPVPTATPLDLGITLGGGGDYAGTGTLAAVTGTVRVFTDASCRDDTAVDLATRRFSAGELGGGVRLFVLADAGGAVRLRLTLGAQASWTIGAPAEGLATATALVLDAESFGPSPRTLVRARRLRNGKMLGVPIVGAWAVRSRIFARATNPTIIAAQLVLEDPDGLVALHAADVVHAAPDVAARALAAPFADAATTYWIAGVAAGNGFLRLGLRLTDGTVLHAGDCLRIRTVAQAAFSAGFEWENKGVDLEQYEDGWARADAAADCEDDISTLLAHAPARMVPRGEAEGLPSKAAAFADAAGIMVVAEVSPTLESYGEFVLGPAYSCAQFNAQVTAVRDLYNALRRYRTLVVSCPERIMNRDHPTRQWAAQHTPMVLRLSGTEERGTPQATFGMPLWMVPRMVMALDGRVGAQRAKTAAENWADAHEADDMVCGLIAACEYYIQCLGGRAVSEDGDGPKAACRVMFRTDFCSMYGLLDVTQRGHFRAWMAAHPSLRQTVPGWSTYRRRNDAYDRRPCTVAQWFDTITGTVVLADGRDALSPPAPYPRHDTGQLIPYAMGKLGADGNHVVAEWRGLQSVWLAGQADFDEFVAAARRWASEILLPGNGLGVVAALQDHTARPTTERLPFQPYP